ncbi:hypothetical protein ES705_13044 [subsurface metagenome]|jgi:hypothetical protein|nr:MAG: hypothetical protein ES695_02020 [Candidatus Atribacteria bacterium 1244-E10-H5-B2]
MAQINTIKLRSLEKTKDFYIWKLKRSESLTEKEKAKYQLALKSINQIIKAKEGSGEKEKHKTIFRRGY